MSRNAFLAYCREQLTAEYGCVPVGIDDALERIADEYARQIEWYDAHVCERW